ncbi:MAG: V-type ATP synthase subunit I [Spirochaetaceae bacterium]|nr:V-type ATP synthase subunit I [Spirochaetaceae bacterium]
MSLERLRELGIVHPEKRNVASASLSKLLDRKVKAEAALGILGSYVIPKGAEPPAAGDPEPLIDRVLGLVDERKTLQEDLSRNVRERSRVEKWGNFEPAALRGLAEGGINLFPYELPVKTWESLSGGEAREHRVIILSRNKASVFLVALDRELPGEIPFALPELSLAGIDRTLGEIQGKLGAIEKELESLAVRKGIIEAGQGSLLERIEFETVRAGMEAVKDIPAELTVSWITGFIPREDLGVLKRAASENNWALIADDPGEDDFVPTKLKNNRFASLINPLTDFLEVVPGYHEVDISGWFLLFFCIFFGMIFGDAGYGALLLLGSIAGIVKTLKKGVPPVLRLFFLLGLSNFTWGVLTCSWFGIADLNTLPGFLRDISLPLISNVRAGQSPRDKGLVQQNLMIFCFSLALLQLSIGHILAILKARTLRALADIGSIAMLAGMYCVVLSLIASNEYRRIPLLMPAVYVFAGGFFLNFLFANYEGNFGRSVLESFKNIISVILGIANVFSDIMSYIRLWAVGLAGAAIASTVNAMAGPMLGHFILFIFGVVLLVFGHGLNIVLNVLSVLVHGVRLNTLEFSGHAGLTWSGYAYKPFAKRIKKEAQSG